MDKFFKLLSAYIAEYNRTPNNGIDMNGKCPDEVYFENLSVKQVVSDLNTLRLLCGNSEEDYIKAAKEKKKARAIVREYKPTRDADIHVIIARNQLTERRNAK